MDIIKEIAKAFAKTSVQLYESGSTETSNEDNKQIYNYADFNIGSRSVGGIFEMKNADGSIKPEKCNGEYTMEDGVKFTVEDGVIKKITDKDGTEQTMEESKTEEKETSTEKKDDVESVEKKEDEEMNTETVNIENPKEPSVEENIVKVLTDLTNRISAVEDTLKGMMNPTEMKSIQEKMEKMEKESFSNEDVSKRIDELNQTLMKLGKIPTKLPDNPNYEERSKYMERQFGYESAIGKYINKEKSDNK